MKLSILGRVYHRERLWERRTRDFSEIPPEESDNWQETRAEYLFINIDAISSGVCKGSNYTLYVLKSLLKSRDIVELAQFAAPLEKNYTNICRIDGLLPMGMIFEYYDNIKLSTDRSFLCGRASKDYLNSIHDSPTYREPIRTWRSILTRHEHSINTIAETKCSLPNWLIIDIGDGIRGFFKTSTMGVELLENSCSLIKRNGRFCLAYTQFIFYPARNKTSKRRLNTLLQLHIGGPTQFQVLDKEDAPAGNYTKLSIKKHKLQVWDKNENKYVGNYAKITISPTLKSLFIKENDSVAYSAESDILLRGSHEFIRGRTNTGRKFVPVHNEWRRIYFPQPEDTYTYRNCEYVKQKDIASHKYLRFDKLAQLYPNYAKKEKAFSNKKITQDEIRHVDSLIKSGDYIFFSNPSELYQWWVGGGLGLLMLYMRIYNPSDRMNWIWSAVKKIERTSSKTICEEVAGCGFIHKNKITQEEALRLLQEYDSQIYAILRPLYEDETVQAVKRGMLLSELAK